MAARARAQQAERVRRIGVLTPSAADDPDGQGRHVAFVQGLEQLGWTDGRNVRIDQRWGAGNPDEIRKYARELVALAPDVILATGSAAVEPLLQASTRCQAVLETSRQLDELTIPVGKCKGVGIKIAVAVMP